jgi:hypothetical protein
MPLPQDSKSVAPLCASNDPQNQEDESRDSGGNESPLALGQRQTCKACGRPDKFDFHVPDAIWQRVVPLRYRNRVLCLYCFDGFAAERGIEYAPHLRTLWFAGDGAKFEFRAIAL